MRKKKMKDYLKIGILLLGVSLFLINCNTDLDETILKTNSEITVKNLNFQDIQLNEKILQKLELIFHQEKGNSLYAKDTIYNSEYDFYINLNDVKYVESGDYHSYNFSITRNNPIDDKLENLFLTLNSQGSYDAYILKYDFTPEELNNLDENTLSTRNTEYTPINFDVSFKIGGESPVASRYVCTETWTLVGIVSPRTFEVESYEWVSTITCEYVAGAGIGTDYSGNDTTSGDDTSGGGGTGTDETTETTIISAPVLSPEAKMLDAFFENLTPEQEEYLDSQVGTNLHSEIKTFLLANFDENNTALDENFIDAQNFAKLVLDSCGAEVDWVERIINGLEGKALCVYQKLLVTGISSYHNLITDLFIEFGEDNIGGDNITFKMSTNLPNNVGGRTYADNFGNYYIEINSNLMNTLSSIEVAAILVHEISHAFLGKHYNNSNATFKELYQQYINDTGIANYSHDIMKDYFINRMASVLQSYDNSIFSSLDDYKILSAQGVYDLSTEELNRLSDIKIISRENDTNCN